MQLTSESAFRARLVLPELPRLFLAAWLGVLVSTTATAGARSNQPAPTQSIAFDIPAQPLDQALETYGSRTGWEVLYNSNLAVGRWSGEVRDRFTPEAALQAMLRGTGLALRHTDVTSVVLVPAPPAVKPQAAAGAVADGPPARWNYYARIQQSLRVALCRNGEAAPGHYRIAAQFWIGPTGDVVGYQRLGSTGETLTDRWIDRALRGLRIGASPPAGFAEPVTILVVPQAADVTLGCGSDHAGLKAVKAEP